MPNNGCGWLKKEKKLLVVIGVLQQDEETNEYYDYSGVLYPEGNVEQYMFNHDMIERVIFRGYEDAERDVFINSLVLEDKNAQDEADVIVNNVLLHLYETKDSDNCSVANIAAISDRFNIEKDDVKSAIEFLEEEQYIEQKKMSRNKYRLTQKGLEIFQ